MDPTTLRLVQGAAGAAGGATYVDDVFSTFLYTATGSSLALATGQDLDAEGGMVWLKSRSATRNHAIVDSARGVDGSGNYKSLYPNLADAEYSPGSAANAVATSFNSNGLTLGNNANTNTASDTQVAWSFRKAPGFFDVVTYTGNGSSTGDSQTISHDLGSTPGFVMIKRTTGVTGEWVCWHRSTNTTGTPTYDNRRYLQLNSTNGTGSMGVDIWGTVNSTGLEVKHNGTVGDSYEINKNGQTYVAYFFAHDDQSFGTNEDESIIKCGTVTTSASATASINLGFEPQWVLFKATDTTLGWYIWDTMRGIFSGGADAFLLADSTAIEASGDNISVTPTGFDIVSALASTNWIYMAIRRPNKPPTAGTDVFMPIAATSSSGTTRTTGFPIDLQIGSDRSRVAIGGSFLNDRLRGVSTNATALGRNIYSSSTAAETTTALTLGFDNTGFKDAAFYSGYPMCWWNFKRAPGFFDVVAYTGTGSSGANTGQQNITHNLQAVPELMLVKGRDYISDPTVYNATSGAATNMRLNRTNANISDTYCWDNTTPTSSVFRVGAALNGDTNVNTKTYIAYLFATLPGISKVGSYPGTGNAVDVDCGFSAGARFILIKRTDSTGDWYVWDTARGIVSGDDPYLLLNSSAAEVTNTDYIDPLASGFTVTSSAPDALNADGGTYIFLAIA